MPTIKSDAKVVQLAAHRWIGDIRDSLPQGTSLRDACMKAQRAEIELFERLSTGQRLKG